MLFLLLLPSDFSLLSDISTNVPSSGETWASQVELVVKNLPANAGDVRDVGSIPGSGRSPRGGHGNSLLYSCLENSIEREAWQVTGHGVTKSQI